MRPRQAAWGSGLGVRCGADQRPPHKGPQRPESLGHHSRKPVLGRFQNPAKGQRPGTVSVLLGYGVLVPSALPKSVARGHQEAGAVPRKSVSLRALGPPSCTGPTSLFPCLNGGDTSYPTHTHSGQRIFPAHRCQHSPLCQGFSGFRRWVPRTPGSFSAGGREGCCG